MQITIDTNKDSKEEIRRIIELLQLIVEREIQKEVPIEKPKPQPDELLDILTKPKKQVEGMPKSVKDALDLSQDMETY